MTGATYHADMTATTRPRRRPLLIVLAVLAAVAVLLGAVGLWAVHSFGPRVGLYLTPPSPERYAQVALEDLDQAYHAEGPEWEAAREELLAAAESAEEIPDLYPELEAAVEAAGGKHSFFLDPQEAEDSAAEATTDFTAPAVESADGVTTLTVPALGSVSEDLQSQYAEAAATGIDDAAPGTCGWIIDLRGNTGGNMYPMLSGLSPLLPDGEAMRFQPREGEGTAIEIFPTGAGAGEPSVPIPEGAKVSGQPVALLQDDMTASSGEAVLTAFRGVEGTRTFGEDSAGYTSGNSIHQLYDGAQMVLTNSVYVDREGTSLEERPIPADEPVAPEDAEQAAAEWLAEQGCG